MIIFNYFLNFDETNAPIKEIEQFKEILGHVFETIYKFSDIYQSIHIVFNIKFISLYHLNSISL